MARRKAPTAALIALAAVAACRSARPRESDVPGGVVQSIEIRMLVSPEAAVQLVQGAARDAGLIYGKMTVSGNSAGTGQRTEVVIGPYHTRYIRDIEITLRAVIIRELGAGSRVVVSGIERVPDPRDETKTRTRPIVQMESDDPNTWDEVVRWADAIKARAPR